MDHARERNDGGFSRAANAETLMLEHHGVYAQAKARKDLAQADALIRILAEDRPYLLKEAYETALESGPKWKEAIERSLAQQPRID